MAKNLHIAVLLDFYGQMLTEKQRNVVELYYNEDLSLAEIAEHSGITRQGVRDSIKRAEVQLMDFEDKLRLVSRFRSIQLGLEEIVQQAGDLEAGAKRAVCPEDICSKTRRIKEVATRLGAAYH